MSTITAPISSRSRQQAEELFSCLPDDLSDTEIYLDLSTAVIATPSFADEAIRQVLLHRRARLLHVVHTPVQYRDTLIRAAKRLGCSDRLVVSVSEPKPEVACG